MVRELTHSLEATGSTSTIKCCLEMVLSEITNCPPPVAISPISTTKRNGLTIYLSPAKKVLLAGPKPQLLPFMNVSGGQGANGQRMEMKLTVEGIAFILEYPHTSRHESTLKESQSRLRCRRSMFSWEYEVEKLRGDAWGSGKRNAVSRADRQPSDALPVSR
jgi:hypothetical protein